MDAHDMPLSKVIDIDAGAREHFHVPKYQREYAWGHKEWEQLLQDIDENDPGYFMGSLICVNDNADRLAGDEVIYEVVDGQQRLTTLSLLLMALFVNLNKKLKDYSFEDEVEEWDTRKTQLSIKDKLLKLKKDPRPGEQGSFSVGKNIYFMRVQPSVQNHNLEDYRYLLYEIGMLTGQSKPRNCSQRRIYRAFAYFLINTPTEVPAIRSFVEKINQLIFVQITVGSQSDAFTLFESLNNRGIPLSAIDIIKNKLLAEMERQHHVELDDSFTRWQEIIDALPDPVEQERFLRHFYNAFKHLPSIQVDKVTRATKSQIIRIYETLIKRSASNTFDELTSKAKLYGTLLRPENGSTSLSRGLTELQHIGAAPAYQILLFLFSLSNERLQPVNFLTEAVKLLCRYYIRRNLTDTPATRDLDTISIELIAACVETIKLDGCLTLEAFTHLLLEGRGRPASLRQFRSILEGPIYAENIGMTRYLLIQLDLLYQTREYQPDLWARDDKDRFIWTIEHVLPQAEKLPQHWIEMIAAGNSSEASAVQDKYVNLLGNLTLSGYNSDLGTSSFEKKQQLAKDRTFLGHKINIGYRNGLALNNLPFTLGDNTLSLATATKWSAEMIEARTNTMVDLLLEANKLPGE